MKLKVVDSYFLTERTFGIMISLQANKFQWYVYILDTQISVYFI